MKIGFLVLMVSSAFRRKNCENSKKLQPFEINVICFILKDYFRVLIFITVVPHLSGGSL